MASPGSEMYHLALKKKKKKEPLQNVLFLFANLDTCVK